VDRPETVSGIIGVNEIIWEEPKFKTKMIHNDPKNESKNGCDGQKHKQIETAIPYTLLQPHRPKSEAHKSKYHNHNNNKPDLLASCFIGLIFKNHVNTFIRHWILRLIWNNILWQLHLILPNDSCICLHLDHVSAEHHELSEFDTIFDGL